MLRFQILLIIALAASLPSSSSKSIAESNRLDNTEVHVFADQANGFRDEDQHLDAYQIQGVGWTNTSSGPSGLGQPAVLTWSIVPDGTSLPGGVGEPALPSNLVSFLDGIHEGGASPGGTDLTQRSWFPLFESAFERWDELSGITFNYQPDAGGSLPSAPGVLGVRGDHRIGGHSIDGQISPTILAYNYFPNTSDMVIDTDESIRWSDPEGNYLKFRNMVTHEVGHGLGLAHVVSSDSQFLLEPFLATDFDGPQLDDILAIHRLYGDVNEEGSGNETYLDATSLGEFWPGQSLTIGSDAADTIVESTDVDFLSIDDDSDTDFFHFSTTFPAFINLDLTPLGPTYLQGPNTTFQNLFNASAQSDLSITLWDSDGTTVLETANDTGLGQSESIEGVFLFEPGDYYVSINGAQNAAQFYELSLDLDLPFPNDSGSLWEIIRRFGGRAGFGDFFGGDGLPIISENVPEPTSAVLLAGCLMCCLTARQRKLN